MRGNRVTKEGARGTQQLIAFWHLINVLFTTESMKKVILFLLGLSLALSAGAQRWTIWYGVSISDEIRNSSNSYNPKLHFSNCGVDYAFMVSNWDFTLGAGLNTKGQNCQINYAQLEGNAAYRFINTDSGFSLSALTGPYFGVKVADNSSDWDSGVQYEPRSVGWQAGIQMIFFKRLSLKVGYERAFNTPMKGYAQSSDKIPHSLFIRIGDAF